MEEAMIEQLFEAATQRDSSLIKNFDSVNFIDLISLRNSRDQTLLHVTAGYGRTSFVSFLISKGANVDAQDIEGQAPLHNACCHGHYTVSAKLIKAGANVNLADVKGWTPLHFALARKDNRERISPIYWKVIELLIDSGADPYAQSKSGKSCLYRIKNSEDGRIVRKLHLLNMIKDCDEEYREKNINQLMSLEDFFEMVRIGDEDIELLVTPHLLNSQLSNCDNITPLHRAAGHNHLNLAKFFIRRGAKVDAIDGLGRIPLHNAAQYGHVEMIELLVKEGSNICKQDLYGYSPLHLAASNPTFPGPLKLIELGADLNLRCQAGKLPFDLAESDDVKEVLKPNEMRHRLEIVPSATDQAHIYIDLETVTKEPALNNDLADNLMLNSESNEPLFKSHHTIKKIILNEDDWRYRLVRKRMLESIVTHSNDLGRYSTYEIISIECILHKKVWSKYKLACQRLEIDYGPGSKNEKLLFHGSNFIEKIQSDGFDERYAQRDGMFGAGIYFAKHSSKSNQYTFGWGQGCQEHRDKFCYVCERKMIYAQVALGRSLISKEAMSSCAHAPPGYSSVTGTPESTDNLIYPEYVIYSGDQAYPLFIIRYKISR